MRGAKLFSRSRLMPIAVAMIVAPLLSAAADLSTLNWLNPLPQGDRIRAVTFGNNEYLAISDSGIIDQSSDGQFWETIAELPIDIYPQVHWDGARYITFSFGVSGAVPLLWTSANGRQWTGADIGVSLLNAAASNGPRWVLVGRGGAIVYSDNLQSFFDVAGFSDTLVGVAWTGIQFVTLAEQNNVLLSMDGSSWTAAPTNVEGVFSSLAYGNGVLVAAGSRGSLMSSADGLIWTPRDSGSTAALKVLFDGSDFLLLAGASLLRSADGVNWTPTSGTDFGTFSLAAGGVGYVSFSAGADRYFSEDLSTWITTTDAFTSQQLHDVADNRERTVAVGLRATVAVTEDGQSWSVTPEQIGSGSLNHIHWSGQEFVVAGIAGVVAVSEHGINWTRLNPDGNEALQSAVSAGDGYLAVGNGGVITGSDDGSVWQTRVSGTSSNLIAVAYNGSRYVAVGQSGTIISSSDGFVWESANSGTTVPLTDVTFGAGQFVAVGLIGTVLTSPDGIIWTAQLAPTTRALQDVIYDGSQFIVLGDATLITSSDAVQWTQFPQFRALSGLAVSTTPNLAVVVGRNGAILTAGFRNPGGLIFEDGFED